jgi:SAM-dependent methyltransferase
MSQAQQQTLSKYRELLRVNGAAHLLRVARQRGLFAALTPGQRTLPELAKHCGFTESLTHQWLTALSAIGVIEQYGEDYALAPVVRLLDESNSDLHDGWWALLDQPPASEAAQSALELRYLREAAATQWTQTGVAVQLAEVLEIGQERRGPRVLDLGCGAAVWSTAMAYRDPEIEVWAVGDDADLGLASQTAASVNLGSRFHPLIGDPLTIALPDHAFDLVMFAGQLRVRNDQQVVAQLKRARQAATHNGELVIVDQFLGPPPPALGASLEALRLQLATSGGTVRSPAAMEDLALAAGWTNCQFVFLTASTQDWGALVARAASCTRKPSNAPDR